jgi:flagellar biosynthesis protein FlhG
MIDQAARLRELDRQRSGQRIRQVRTIAVTSGKGGVGKSNLTVNMALALGQLGNKVLILDADLGMANVDILLGESPRYHLQHVIRGEKSIKEVLISGPLGISIIPGSNGIVEVANLKADQQNRFITELMTLRDSVDYILIDTGAGLSKNILAFLMAVDEVIIVMTPEPTSAADAYSMVKILAGSRIHSCIHLLLNMANTPEEGNRAAQRFMRVVRKYLSLEVQYLGCVPYDRAIMKSVREQKPFLLNYPKSQASVHIRAIVSQMTGETKDQHAPGRSLGSFVQSLVRVFS